MVLRQTYKSEKIEDLTMNGVMNALDVLFKEETMTEYKKREDERRKLFFKAIGKPDDRRLCPTLFRDEFSRFCRERKVSDKQTPKNATLVEVYFEQVAYYDYSYRYCFEDDMIYKSGFYVGD